MNLWPRRNKPPTAPLRPDRRRIAVLENELLGVEPEPGTPEAHAVAMAKPVDRDACPHDAVIDLTEMGQTRAQGVCERCGAAMIETDDGTWERP